MPLQFVTVVKIGLKMVEGLSPRAVYDLERKRLSDLSDLLLDVTWICVCEMDVYACSFILFSARTVAMAALKRPRKCFQWAGSIRNIDEEQLTGLPSLTCDLATLKQRGTSKSKDTESLKDSSSAATATQWSSQLRNVAR